MDETVFKKFGDVSDSSLMKLRACAEELSNRFLVFYSAGCSPLSSVRPPPDDLRSNLKLMEASFSARLPFLNSSDFMPIFSYHQRDALSVNIGPVDDIAGAFETAN